MSELIDREDRRYIKTVRSPYPGYRVTVHFPDKADEVLSKSLYGYQKPLDFYLQAARAWRDTTYRHHFGVPIPKRIFRKKSSAAYGVPGVQRVVKIVNNKLKSGELRVSQLPCVVAEVHLISDLDYKRSKRSRSKIYLISKYGEDEAVRLATRWREAMMI